MTRLRLIKTSFSAGELDPRLLGRIDLKAQEEGASRLRNVLVQATGGVSRRPGTAYACDLPDARRLVGFDSAAGGEIIAFRPFGIDIVSDEEVVATLAAPWGAAQLAQLAWARLGDSLLLCHPEVEPRRLTRAGAASWTLAPWRFDERDGTAAFNPSTEPFARFAPADVAMQPVRTDVSQPASAAIPAGATVELRASDNVFLPLHVGARFRVRRRQVMVTILNPTDAAKATALVLEDLANGESTRDWDEAAFSMVRGFPRSLTFHQNRLVIGGSRDLPERIWMSRTGRPFDFDLGSGLDDEAIAFRLAADRLHVISSVHSGRQLQVFTSAGEWVVKGFPLTPANVQVDQQTGIGSYAARRLPPLGVDGATLFVGTTGRELREFLFADTEQAYQAADIALLARHLMLDPVDLTFDAGRRLLLVVRADGAIAAVTIDRNSNVVAWSLLETQGHCRAALAFAGEVWLLVERAGVVRLERLDDKLHLDCALGAHSGTPRTSWFGFDHLDGQPVMVVADDVVVGPLTVSDGSLTLPSPANDICVGLPFAHEVEALPIMASTGRGLAPDVPYRPIRITFRLLETRALHVDTGPGPRPLPLPAAPGGYTGDVMTRATGWRRGIAQPPWRIAQDLPRPCTILSATTEIKVND
jgi:hypothetical protein